MIFKPCNKKIGTYLGDLIKNNYKNDRQFCIEYLKFRDGQDAPSPDDIQKMQNRISQIKNGNKSVQLEDLPIFSELLGVSFEEIVSAGTVFAPTSNRKTNYSIAHSSDPAEWEAYIQREDKLILNPDEYDKTAIDYALEAGNYPFLKFLLDEGYIWFVGNDKQEYYMGFGAGTSIERRKIGHHDPLEYRLQSQDDLRFKMIALAIRKNDFEMLDTLHAREIPLLYRLNQVDRWVILDDEYPFSSNVEQMIASIAASGEKVLSYFFEAFEVEAIQYDSRNTYIFPYAGKVLDEMIRGKRTSESKSFLERAIKHNRNVWKKLQRFMSKNKAGCENYYRNVVSADYQDEAFVNCEIWKDYFFYPETGVVAYSRPRYIEDLNLRTGFITNVIRVTVSSKDPEVQALIEKLNNIYDDFTRQLENKEA